MKRYVSILLAVVLLATCLLVAAPGVYAAGKATESRGIAIVFDNSGSMYIKGEQAWCRATYAMEVFASMLNAGDTLQIYPMHPITVDGKDYTMENPLEIKNASQATSIRRIYTKDAQGTPIESIDCAVKGLQKLQASKKYMIVLTDGDVFYENDKELSSSATKKALDERIQANAGKGMTVMYLGIGQKASMPETPESEYFVKKKAANSADVLSILTVMCNQIFGRDTLPKNHITNNNKTIDFDISISKLIVFVQGENISDLKLTGDGVGKLVSAQQTKYAEKSCGNYDAVSDTSLQGMMVTYSDCAAGTYNIDFAGTASSVEVYYEPDADLDFVFTDTEGNTVDPNALYEGEYKVSFGMKDARTGQLINSDLLGKTNYRGSYTLNGKKVEFTSDKSNDAVSVNLAMGDTFEAELTATYLSGYTIHKDSTDFGWPQGGIKVAARPAGELRLEITGGDGSYSLQDLEKGSPYIAKVYYQGAQLTGSELENVELKWQPETSNAEIRKTFADDHWKLTLHYKDSEAPEDTVCGACTVSIYAFYTPQGSSQAQAQTPLTYNIRDDQSPLRMELFAPQLYFVMKDLEDSEPIRVDLRLNGERMTEEDFANLQLQVDCGGIANTVTPNAKDSSYTIKLLPTEGIEAGDYPIKITALYTDHIGREIQVDDEVEVTLSKVPMWVRWVIGLIVLIALILLIIAILRKKVFPKRVKPDMEGCMLTVGAKDETENANFYAKQSGKQLTAYVEYNAEEIGRVSLNNLLPGKESYLSKPSHKRSILVKFPENINMAGNVTAVDVAGVGYVVNKDEKLVPEDEQQNAYTISNGGVVTINGKTLVGGKEKRFNAEIPLNFRK